jgi:nucleoside-diphosphate-sugar epimerase
MSVFIVGRHSYLGGVLLKYLGPHHSAQGINLAEVAEIPIAAEDVIVNCAFSPDWYHTDVPGDLGFDGTVAAVARRSGARYVMISSRAVYPSRLEPPLCEDEPVAPATVYGKNKAKIEAGLRQILGERLLVLRLANVFGAEPVGRRTFVSTALRSLVRDGTIELDIAPSTRKDFVPSSFVGQAAASLIARGADGIINVGSGIALPLDQVASALIRGYGNGSTRVTGTMPGEEFRLDVSRLRQRTEMSLTAQSVLLELETVARDCKQHVSPQ